MKMKISEWIMAVLLVLLAILVVVAPIMLLIENLLK